MWIL
jgi:L-fuconate dehydratase